MREKNLHRSKHRSKRPPLSKLDRTIVPRSWRRAFRRATAGSNAVTFTERTQRNGLLWKAAS